MTLLFGKLSLVRHTRVNHAELVESARVAETKPAIRHIKSPRRIS
jgi:hypothetical protein